MPRPLKGAVLEHTGRQVTRVLRTVEHYEPKSKRELASLCGLSVGQTAATIHYMNRDPAAPAIVHDGRRWKSAKGNRSLARYDQWRRSQTLAGLVISSARFCATPSYGPQARRYRHHLEARR